MWGICGSGSFDWIYDLISAGVGASVRMDRSYAVGLTGYSYDFDVFEDGSVHGTVRWILGSNAESPRALYWMPGDVAACEAEATDADEFDCIIDALGREELMGRVTGFYDDCDDALIEATGCLDDEWGANLIEVCDASFCDARDS